MHLSCFENVVWELSFINCFKKFLNLNGFKPEKKTQIVKIPLYNYIIRSVYKIYLFSKFFINYN